MGRNFTRVILDVMQVVAMKRKTKLYGSGVLVACIVVTIVGYFALWADRGFTVYDDRFNILDYGISAGMIHTMYHGNQTAGRMRATLRDRFGLKFVDLPPAVRIVSPRSRTFLLRYTGDFPFDELKDLRVTLTNDKGISKELVGWNVPDQTKQTFVGGCIIPGLPVSEDSFRIELRLKSSHDPIASWRVGKLYRNNKRITPNP